MRLGIWYPTHFAREMDGATRLKGLQFYFRINAVSVRRDRFGWATDWLRNWSAPRSSLFKSFLFSNSCKKPAPTERENIFGERSAASLQEHLQQRLLHWYIISAGVAPMDKDQRNCPPFYVGRRSPDQGWQQALWIL